MSRLRPCQDGLENGGTKFNVVGLSCPFPTFPHLGGHRDPPYSGPYCRSSRPQQSPSDTAHPVSPFDRYAPTVPDADQSGAGGLPHHVSPSLSDISPGGQTSPGRIPYTGLGIRYPKFFVSPPVHRAGLGIYDSLRSQTPTATPSAPRARPRDRGRRRVARWAVVVPLSFPSPRPSRSSASALGDGSRSARLASSQRIENRCPERVLATSATALRAPCYGRRHTKLGFSIISCASFLVARNPRYGARPRVVFPSGGCAGGPLRLLNQSLV